MTSSKITLIFLLLLTIVLSSSTIYAQHNHSNHQHESMHEMDMKPAPHGGELKDAGKYQVEMIAELFLKEDQLIFYLYKGNLKLISTEGITGTITLTYNDGTNSTEPLFSKGSSHFVAQLENKEAFQCVVSFLIKDKTFSAVFSHPGLGLNSLGRYICPMHSDIESNKPEDCPKCGMKLEYTKQDMDNQDHQNQ